MKYISLFSGVGGFDLALNRLGHECVYANEWDKYASSIYRKHFGEIDTRDITTVPTTDIPDHDLLVGGFPCQSFSIAGKRLGFDDTRGTMFFEVARILKHKRPRYLLLENVKGLLSHDSGKTFQTILRVLTDIGYECQWMVLNSKDFGVPQNRERVFIVGNLREASRPEIFPIGSTNEIHSRPNENKEKVHDIASTMTARQYASWNGNFLQEVTKNQPQGYRVYDVEGISTTIATQAGGLGAKTGLYAMRWERTEKGKEARRLAQSKGRDYTPFGDGYRQLTPVPDKPVGTITSQAIAKDSLIGNYTKIRRLTPLEAERLQSFPDNFTKYGIDAQGNEVLISDSQRYKVLGNAVTVNVVFEIAKKLQTPT